MERRPRYFVSAEERARRDAFFAAHGLQGKTVVGVQVRAEESYRDYAHVRALVGELARDHPVLLFDNRPIAGDEIENTIKVDGVGLREAFALASGCDVLVAPDSSFVHLGAALGVPCVGLFGPTDGRVRTRPYPGVRSLDVRRDLRCVPCWRNEEIPCALTGMRTSVCMGAIEVASVERAVGDLLRERPGHARAAAS
jgi:ADP-heptose:LPS heptosyltransferase